MTLNHWLAHPLTRHQTARDSMIRIRARTLLSISACRDQVSTSAAVRRQECLRWQDGPVRELGLSDAS